MFRRLRNFVKRTAPVLIALGVATVFVVVHITIESDAFEFGPLSRKGLIHLLDLKALDLKFLSQPRQDAPEPKVTIAAIDEKSVERFGLWPWSRRVIAKFVRATADANAKVIAFDAVFSDEDKNSSYRSIKRFQEMFAQQGLAADSPQRARLRASLQRAQKLARQSAKALAALKKQAQSTPKRLRNTLLPALASARSLHQKRLAAVEAARAALQSQLKALNGFEQRMQQHIDTISPDQALADAIRRHRDKTILGYFNFYNRDEIAGVDGKAAQKGFQRIQNIAIDDIFEYGLKSFGGQQVVMLRPLKNLDMAKMQIREAVGTRVPLPLFAEAADYFGYFNAPPDRDGPIRRIRLFNKRDEKLYPALSLLTAARYFDSEIRPVNGKIKPGVTIDGIAPLNPDREAQIPTDLHGRLLVNYYKNPEDYFPQYSVADFIDGNVPAKHVKDRIILFGMTAQGLDMDLRATPFSSATPGVFIHAQAIQNIIDGDYLQRWYGLAIVEALSYLLLGLLMGLIFPRLPAWGGLLATLAFAGGLYLIDINFLFRDGVWFLNVLPTLQAGITFLGITVYGYLTEGREKRKIRQAFQFYLTKSVVDEMLKDPSKLKLGGEKRDCTVLFSDIRGFTTISEQLSPEGLVNLLNEYLTPMTDLVFRYEGTLDKYMGDAIMAIFGAPIAHTDHSVRACHCSLDMMEALEGLKKQWNERGLPEMDIGIGLNTGPMSVGNMGSAIRFDYTVMGDNVNLGSRLEGINKQYGTNIIISEYTRHDAADHIAARELDSVRVKGKQEPVRIYELLAKGRPQGVLKKFIDNFEHGIALYKQQRWDEAIEVFQRVHQEVKKGDYASKLYVERCEAMKANPPGDDWDGVFTMTTK